MNAPLVVAAPAKLNLYLHVTGRRADGYHTLDSLIAFLDLADVVTATDAPAGRFTLALDGPFAAAPGLADTGTDTVTDTDTDTGTDTATDTVTGNLALRAARALDAFAGGGHGCALHLVKNIPVAAGLGGGSADAAAVLVALARLWGLADAPLAEIGLALGADVPVCLAAAPSLVTGIGERVAPAPVPPAKAGVVLVNPGVAVETRAVFTAFDAAPAPVRTAPAPLPGAGWPDVATLVRHLAATGNDLTEAAERTASGIAGVLEALAADAGCRLARMAGSGATCFGLYDDRAAAARAAAALARHHPGWWVWSGGFGGRG